MSDTKYLSYKRESLEWMIDVIQQQREHYNNTFDSNGLGPKRPMTKLERFFYLDGESISYIEKMLQTGATDLIFSFEDAMILEQLIDYLENYLE